MTSSHPSAQGPGWHDRGDDQPWSDGRGDGGADDRSPADDRTGVDGGDDRAPAAVLPRPVLVTTFGGSPEQPVDPTVAVADTLAGDEDVVAHVLEASYDRAVEQLDQLVRMVDPLAVVCFGVAGEATTVRIEQRAGRLDDSPIPDVDGDVRLGVAIDRGPDHVATRLDVDEIAAALVAAGVPVERSRDAGGHVGNHVLRHALLATALLDRPVGLVHVPPLGTPGFDHARVAAAGRVVVRTVVGRLAGRPAD